VRRRLGIRWRLLAVSTAAVAAALVVLVAGFNLVLRHELDRSARDRAIARAAATLSQITVHDGRLTAPEAPDAAAVDVPVWIFAGDRPIEQPREGSALNAAAAALAASGAHSSQLSTPATRLASQPIEQHGRRLGTVVAAVSLEPYRETERTALLLSLVAAAALLTVVALAIWSILGRALAPVSEMTRAAAIWSEHDLDRRFGVESPDDEIGQLAATLDGLLDRIASAIKREQLFTAEISHELRTPLARICGEVELALRRPRNAGEYREALITIDRNARRLTRIVDTLLDAARAEAGQRTGTSDAVQVARTVATAAAPLADQCGVRVDVSGARGARIPVNAELAARILQPLVENACHYGRSQASIAVVRADGAVIYEITDDGEGVGQGQQEAIFEPGARGQAATATNGVGAGLGLALARRMARAVGGEVSAEPGPGGRFLVSIPQAR
jgi:two-component system, OmpR family, sensor kinase